MAGIDSNQLRSAFVAEVTANTTPSTPAFLTTHSRIIDTGQSQRIHQGSQVAGGAFFGDALLTKKSTLEIRNAPLVYGLYDPLLESLFQGSWSTNVLKDAKLTKTVTVENSIPAGAGGTRTYMRHTGVEAISGSLVMQADQTINLSLGLMGRTVVDATETAISGATYTDPTNNDPFSAAVDLGAVTLAGYTLDGIVNFTVDFVFDGREPQAIGGTTLNGITRGACRVTVKMRCYVDANFLAIYNAARQATVQSAVLFTANFGSVTNKKYKLEILKANIDMAPLDLTGATGFHDINLTGTYSTSDSAVMKLTRNIA